MGQLVHKWKNSFFPKNGLWIALGRLVELLEKIFWESKKKWVLSKNGLRIAVGRLVKLLEKKNWRKGKKKVSTFQRWS